VKKQNINQMFASLVKQLCCQRPDTPQAIKSLGEYKEKGQCPDTETLRAMLTTVAKGFSTVYIVVDALDECPPLEGERKRLLSSLRQFMTTAPDNIHVFCTSRKEADIDLAMGSLLPPPLRVAAIDLTVRRNDLDHDIGLFIDSTIASGDYLSWPERIKAEAKESLIERADGM
jgi:ATP/maltotriose-dependent transcriptional regulator MalT